MHRAMTGTIRQRGKNSWELRVYGGTDPLTGRRRWHTRTVRGSRTEAQRELTNLAAIANVAPVVGARATMAELLDRWFAASVARSVTSCDVNEEPLEIARARRPWRGSVTFTTCDAFALYRLPGRFDAAFVGFFWSHLRLDQLDSFLAGLISRLEPGATVVLADNRYVEGSNHPITRTDDEGNSYQQRRLADGREWEVLKNFPSPEDVEAALARHRTTATIRSMTFFWAATARRPGGC